MTVSAEHQDAGSEPGVMIQPWPQHSAQILMAWRGVTSTTRVRANPLFCERHKGAMFPSSESSGLTWFLLTRAGFLSLCVICQIFTYLSPADPRGTASTRGQFVRAAEQSKVIIPRAESPLLPASPREHPRCLPGNKDLRALELPFSCIDPSAFTMGELFRPSAQLPASLKNVKVWDPHPLWNLAETNLSNQDKSAFGNKTKMV